MELSSNDPELNGKFLGTITSDFVKVADQLKEAAYLLKSRQLSDYPVFVLCQEEQPIGQLLFNRWAENLEWHYYFSMAEEFLQRAILSEEGYANLIENFKNTDEFCCLFVVHPDFTNFVFVPYPED